MVAGCRMNRSQASKMGFPVKITGTIATGMEQVKKETTDSERS
jgi:hypothetical protein